MFITLEKVICRVITVTKDSIVLFKLIINKINKNVVVKKKSPELMVTRRNEEINSWETMVWRDDLNFTVIHYFRNIC